MKNLKDNEIMIGNANTHDIRYFNLPNNSYLTLKKVCYECLTKHNDSPVYDMKVIGIARNDAYIEFDLECPICQDVNYIKNMF